MARMHARRRGIASSVRPFRTEAPEWSNTDAKEIKAKVVELRKTGMTCAQIGLVLRDKHGVPSVKLATGKRVNAIIRENNMDNEKLKRAYDHSEVENKLYDRWLERKYFHCERDD
ncbi:MAG TPA: 30S ribosomal protein S15, partial [Methanocorpusculum sp.]|nr:30S ribosomal protein S15 [Methanocorpusculum sp.]